jgi:hypothetical protein
MLIYAKGCELGLIGESVDNFWNLVQANLLGTSSQTDWPFNGIFSIKLALLLSTSPLLKAWHVKWQQQNTSVFSTLKSKLSSIDGRYS